MRDGSISALFRQGLRDIQDAWLDAWVGNHDHSREPGTPGTPLFSDVEKAREFYRDAPPLIADKTPAGSSRPKPQCTAQPRRPQAKRRNRLRPPCTARPRRPVRKRGDTEGGVRGSLETAGCGTPRTGGARPQAGTRAWQRAGPAAAAWASSKCLKAVLNVSGS